MEALKDPIMSLAGKNAVVLGASASGGTGWAIAERLALAGAKVTVAARRLAPLEDLARRIGGVACVCDAGKGEDIARLARTAVDAFGPIDIAVNAAGHPVRSAIAAATDEALHAGLAVDYIGNVHFIRDMAASMRDGGSIVIISSISASRPTPPYFPYACAKAAADCLVRYAAMEYGPRGIRVNSIQPGLIRSDMARDIFAIPGAEEMLAREVPLGRVGEPSDFADAVLWLAQSPYITGAQLPINGGRQLTRGTRPDEFASLTSPG
jgi:NAD(P)-dependent dehydrogenase (short-subunit alcohol dehydrogenase family)